MKCYDCPRACGADRERGEVGFCGGGYYASVAKTIYDFKYEEPCFGQSVAAVFFGGCALRCSYCQNYKISRNATGEVYDDGKLAWLFDGTDKPIDLVTPSHYLSAIERAVGLTENPHEYIYNTSGYETTESISRAREFCGLFLTDFKYADGELARKLSNAPDYFDKAVAAIREMKKTADVWAGDGNNRTLKQGVVIRHLVLPGQVNNSIAVLDAIKAEFGTDAVLSLMSQFTPNGLGEPTARLKKIEYKLVAEHAMSLGFKNGYFQEFSSADGRYTPEF